MTPLPILLAQASSHHFYVRIPVWHSDRLSCICITIASRTLLEEARFIRQFNTWCRIRLLLPGTSPSHRTKFYPRVANTTWYCTYNVTYSVAHSFMPVAILNYRTV